MEGRSYQADPQLTFCLRGLPVSEPYGEHAKTFGLLFCPARQTRRRFNLDGQPHTLSLLEKGMYHSAVSWSWLWMLELAEQRHLE